MTTPARLRRLLQLRRRQEETSRVQLARSLRKAAEISDEVRFRTEALESALEGSDEPRMRPHLEALSEFAAPAIMAARAAEASAHGTVEEIREEWKRVAMRVKGLERVEERRVDEHALGERRREIVQVDDALNSRLGKGDR